MTRDEANAHGVSGVSDAAAARFWSKVDKTPTCWLWTGTQNGDGYGSMGIKGRTLGVHRIVLMITGTDLIPGMVVDHICRVRNCVNPQHLRQVTNRENILLGIGPTALKARQTHCVRAGHEYTPENTYMTPRGRECRACRTDKSKKANRDKKACPECGKSYGANNIAAHITRVHRSAA